MAEYNKMYTILFNAMSDAIKIMQEAQTMAEEMFISQEDPKITVLKPIDDKPE